jgi:hypothetical protein
MRTLQLFVMIIFISSSFFAQPQRGKVGVSAEIQTQQMDFLLPIFVNDQVSLSPAIGVVNISDKYTDLSLGLLIRYHLFIEKVTPFIGFRAGTLLYIPKEGDMITDLLLGPSFGGEYFFDENFSIGIELQLNIVASGEKSMRFSNPNGTNINSATAIFATIYF